MKPSPFHTIPYLMAYRRHFGAGKDFHRIRLGDETKAFLMTRGRSASRVEWWGAGIHDIGGAIYQSSEDAKKIWQQIEHFSRQHHAARLAQIPESCALLEYAAESGWQIEDSEVCPELALPSTWDGYLKMLGKNMREQMRRYPRRLEKQFSVEYELAQDVPAVEQALGDLFRLHGKRWRSQGQTGVLATPRRQQFHRDVCRAFLKRDWLRLWTLRCDGEAVCVLLNYYHGGKYFFFIGGFDPEWSRLSVGTCLFSRVFQHAIEEGAHSFDFLRGAEAYKYRYGAVDKYYKTISWHSESPRGRLMRHRISLENRVQHHIHERFSAAAKGK